MFTAVFLGMTLVATAPALKGPGIVGEWIVERQETGGGVLPYPEPIHIHFVFSADGKWVDFVDGFAEAPNRIYRVDLTAKPPTIDLLSEPDAKNGYPRLGVFKVDGDTLTLCYSYRRDQRPKGLTVSDDGPYSLFVMKRVKN